jgi:hypothetical protein
MSLIDYVREIHAKQSFKIKDSFKVVSFDDVTQELEIKKDNDQIDTNDLEIWAAIEVDYDGIIPKSYKALNFIIGDWVSSNQKELTKVIHKQLKEFLSEQMPDGDHSEIDENSEDSAIWDEQLDYMPRVDEKKRVLIIEIELVLETEPIDDK